MHARACWTERLPGSLTMSEYRPFFAAEYDVRMVAWFLIYSYLGLMMMVIVLMWYHKARRMHNATSHVYTKLDGHRPKSKKSMSQLYNRRLERRDRTPPSPQGRSRDKGFASQ